MGKEKPQPVDSVRGPEGVPLTLADLPSPQTVRWVARRKAQVVTAVRGGLLSVDDVCNRYALTFDEFLVWERAFARFGLSGLCALHVQEHRLRKIVIPKDVGPHAVGRGSA